MLKPKDTNGDSGIQWDPTCDCPSCRRDRILPNTNQGSRHIWQKCPVCGGRGLVPNGFYNPGPYMLTNSTAPEMCRTCGGNGII